MFIIALALILDLIIFGVLATYYFNLNKFLEERVAVGGVLGMLALGVLMFIFGHILGQNSIGLGLSLLLINFFSFIKLNGRFLELIEGDIEDFRKRIGQNSWKFFHIINLFFILLFGYLASQLLTFKDSSYFIQPVHSYGDISQHLGIISSFAFADNFSPQSTILSGTKISYPFLMDFITSIFVYPLGLRFDEAVAVTGVSFMTFLVLILSFFVVRLTKSRTAAVCVLALFFFNGGLGFFHFFTDFQNSSLSFVDFLFNLHRDYTSLKHLNYWWINVVLSMLLPQRSFLLGLPVSLIILGVFWQLKDKFDFKKFIFGVVLTSFLPIIHAHSLIGISPFLIWFTTVILKKNPSYFKSILMVGFLGFIFALFLSKLYLGQSEGFSKLISVQLGWMSGEENVLQFYFKNFGPILIIAPLAVINLFKLNKNLAIFGLIGQIWLVLPSIFLFQPWDYDNTKLFIYWYLASAVLVSYIFAQNFYSNKTYLIASTVLLLFFMTFSGGLDVFRLLTSSGTRYEVYSPQAIRAGEFIKKSIPTDAVFLSTDKFDNPAVALAGRKTVMGFEGWLWTYGLDYSQRNRDVRALLSGQGGRELLQKYNVTHVILFNEPSNYQIDQSFFDRNFNLIYNKEGYRVYQI